jgi:hypothetical protein
MNPCIRGFRQGITLGKIATFGAERRHCLRPQVVEWLVGHGAELNPRDNFGGSVLLECMTADTEEHQKIIAFLRG